MGKSRGIATADGSSTIKLVGDNALIVERVSSTEIISFGILEERSIIKITPAPAVSYTAFENIMTDSLRVGIDYFDHFISKEKIELPTKERVEQFSSFNPTYNYKNVFNYYSKRFEDISSVQSEISAPPVFSEVSKTDFTEPDKSPFNKLGSSLSNIFYPQEKSVNSNKVLNNFPFYNQVGFFYQDQ